MPVRLAASVLAALLGCGAGSGSETTVSSAETSTGADTEGAAVRTYYRDAKPILDAKCVGCHQPGGVAPFDFSDVDQLYAAREVVRNAIAQGRMPPWPPAAGCTDYLADRSLSDAQVDTVLGWIDDGAALGDPSDEGPPLDVGPVYGLSRVDHTMTMTTPYQPGPEPDDYRCFVVDWPTAERAYLTGLRFNPGTSTLVHHGIVFVAGPEHASEIQDLEDAEAAPGYSCFGGPEVPAAWLGVWVPGAIGGDFPANTGIGVEAGSKVILQIHYSANTSGLSDQTSIDISTEDRVEHEAWIQPWTDPSWYEPSGLLIPAGAENTEVSTALDPVLFVGGGEPLTMHSVGLHMHLLGTSARLSLERADGTNECLLEIPDWDFHWQGAYGLVEPRRLELGDRLRIECRWDNREENQPVVDGERQPSHDTVWGEGTLDEMCLGALYFSKN